MRPDLPKIGDPIEVKFATHDGHIWLPAKVSFVDRDRLVAVHASGRREVIPHGQQRYRRARRASA